MSTTTPKIYSALIAIMRDVEHIEKGDKNKAQGFNFRSIDATYAYLQPIFKRHGVICLPLKVEPNTQEKVSNGKAIRHAVSTVTFRFLAEDGSFIDGQMVGEGLDFSDKSNSKAVSIASKEFLFKTFLVPTESTPDPDYETHELSPHDQKRALYTENERIMKLEREKMAAQGLDEGMTEAFDAPKKPKTNDKWKSYVIQCIAGDRWNGKTLEEIGAKGIATLWNNWVVKNKILENANHPDMDQKKFHEAVMIDLAMKAIGNQEGA